MSELNFRKLYESVLKFDEESDIQSILFSKDKFTKAQAETWLREHNFDVPAVDETENNYRYRQEDPSKFDKIRTSTKDNSEGQKALEQKGIKFIFGID